ncbi:MAG: ATP-binding protein [Candidatus Melainabacteria bacterium]|nr:ATP-binding protein [Candidatus Melainabacteria bacterium]
MKIIEREDELTNLKNKLSVTPIVAILGPRQCGKTTLAHQFADKQHKEEVHFFDLENPADLAKLENPTLTLEELTGFVIIDEIQRKSELFPVLRYLVDKQKKKTKYIILGSASRELVNKSSESLAGRISFLELGGFSLEEVGAKLHKLLWLRGGFPESFFLRTEEMSYEWRQNFITTFLERDIPNLGIQIPPQMLRRFWLMLSHYHGQIFNASEIGRSLNISDTTAKRYLDTLSGTFVIRQLQPWYYNTSKRLVKRPKIYFRDSGIFHTLLSIKNSKDLAANPKLGASWEGFALEQAIKALNLRQEESFFWAVHTGGEIDLIFQKKGKLFGIEFKYNEAPKMTPSMKSALDELSLEKIYVIYPGKENYELHKKITVLSIENIGALSNLS